MGTMLPACAWTATRPFTTSRDEWFVLQRKDEAARELTHEEEAWENARMIDVEAARRPEAVIVTHRPDNGLEMQGVAMVEKAEADMTKGSGDGQHHNGENDEDEAELEEHNGTKVVWVQQATNDKVHAASWTNGGHPWQLRPGDMIAMVGKTALPGPKLRQGAGNAGRSGPITSKTMLIKAVQRECGRGVASGRRAITRKDSRV